ncbi:MAG: glycosyltransferase family 2 protein [Candidatus Spyradocola sp.]|jgi:glycosyltransferase involved in cell wall biosynthesis
MKTLISVIVPLYNEEEVIAESYRRLTNVLSGMEEDYELIFVNDGSRDNTFPLARGIQEKDPHVVLVDFSRNFGHQMAVSAGLEQAKGDAVVIIDADLQDPPELIPKMVSMWKDGAEVVYGKRLSRKGESAFKKLTAFCYYRVLDALSGWKIPKDTGDFRLMDKKVADVLRSMPEHNRFLRGMVSWLGFRQVPLEFEREERFAGTTKYPLKKMLKLAADGIFSFSGKPFGIMRAAGGLLFAAGFVDLIALLIAHAATGASSGWPYAIAVVLLVGGLNLLALGVCGVYFERMYDELKGRPLYIVRQVLRAQETPDRD